MPYFWDRTPETLSRELNPLSNPALERNLSRWAQAYFNNPPGKREQAISKLLQEIKSETSEILLAEQARQESSRSAEETHDLTCPGCRWQNPRGNKFCGQCGAAIGAAGSGSRNSSAFAAMRGPVEATPVQPDRELQWLRDRSLGSLYASEVPARRGSRYLLGGLVIAFAIFAYLQWAPRLPIRLPSTSSLAAQPVTAPASPLPAGQSPAIQPSHAPPAAPGLSQASLPQSQPIRDQKDKPGRVQAAAQKSSLLGTAPSPIPLENPESGLAELRLAQRYLGGSMGARDSTEAAQLLWKAVRQQNTTAAVLLSQLYARGDGVPKSCDQARLLLVAAAKRGAPQAAEQLRDLESRGCR